jgi:predicted XRE-type DNA-binding protein
MTKPPAPAFLVEAIARSGMSNAEIARALGFTRPNVVAMLKSGLMQLPLDRVVPMADLLGIDRAELMRVTRPKEWTIFEQVGLGRQERHMRDVSSHDTDWPGRDRRIGRQDRRVSQ